MDDDKCAMCGKPSPEGRLYCSEGCRAADQGVAVVVGSQPLGTSTGSSMRPPPINTYSYPRRTSHSADISTSDLDSSAASSSSAAARTSSPPSSPGVDDDDDEDDDCSVFFNAQQRRPSLAGGPPLPTMRLSFARRPSQTNSRTMVPLLIPTNHGHGHRRHASLADSRVTAAATAKSPPPPLTASSAAVPWRLTPAQAPAATPVKSPSSPRDSTKPSRSIPASFSRILSGASPLQPLVTITNVDSSGLAALTIPASLPLDRSASQATVRVGRSVAARPLFAQQLRPAPEDSAADGDDSDVDRVVEPLRGRARTRTRRESTASGIDTIMTTTANQLVATKQRTATLRRRDDASPRGSRSIPRRTAAPARARSP